MAAEQTTSKVLVVEDEVIVADTLALILRAKGFDCQVAYSGEDAAEIATTWKPDVVISDVVMATGKMDGVALAIYLAHELPSCKVLLISGNQATEGLLNESKKNGHDFPILAKPCHPEKILEFLGRSTTLAEA